MTTLAPDLGTCEFDPRDAVVDAALSLLVARIDQMDTVDEWLALARSVATCQGTKAAGYLTERDLEQIAEYQMDWDSDRDGALPVIEPD
jgi:hypothetical protein